VIADHDPLFRDTLSLILEAEPDIAVLASEADGESAVATVTALKPDILLTDVLLPRLSWLHVAISYRSAATRPVLMCADFNHRQVLEAMYRGSLGAWMKDQPGLLAECVRCVASGGYWIRNHEALDVSSMIREIEDEVPNSSVSLTSREEQVVRFTLSGMTDRDIGERLNIREETVKRHLARMSDKLGISNRSELVRFVVEQRVKSSAQGGNH
jgi:DNA-binding NarL/FixJ family response regulator